MFVTRYALFCNSMMHMSVLMYWNCF